MAWEILWPLILGIFLSAVVQAVGSHRNLNCPIGELIKHRGFRIERLDNGYMRGLKPFMYEGAAQSR